MDNLVLNLEINLKTIGTNSYGLQKEIRFCDLRNFFMFFIFQVKMGGNKAFYFLLKNRQIHHDCTIDICTKSSGRKGNNCSWQHSDTAKKYEFFPTYMQ